jgi:hypothetical protein
VSVRVREVGSEEADPSLDDGGCLLVSVCLCGWV